jgi:hypothetical protein
LVVFFIQRGSFIMDEIVRVGQAMVAAMGLGEKMWARLWFKYHWP